MVKSKLEDILMGFSFHIPGLLDGAAVPGSHLNFGDTCVLFVHLAGNVFQVIPINVKCEN